MEISCVICLNNMSSTDELYGTLCGHVCHAACMNNWMQRSATCPQCRHPVRRRDIGRIYLNFTNSENSLMDSIMTNHRSELETLRTIMKMSDKLLGQKIETIARLEEQIKKKDLEEARHINLINVLHVEIAAGKRHLEEQIAEFSKIKVAMQKQISELEEKYKSSAWQALAQMLSTTDDPAILLQKIAGMKRELTSTVERCQKLEESVAGFSKRFLNECEKKREIEKRLEICTREKLELEAQIAEVKENVKAGINLVVPKVEKNASESTIKKPKLEGGTADGKSNVKTQHKTVQPKAEKNASKSNTKIRASRLPLDTINQNSKPSHYNLRPR